MKAALTAADANFFYVSLIDGEDFAHLRSAGAVCQAVRLFGEPGAGDQQIAAGSALAACSLPGGVLVLDICFMKMGQNETSQFAAGVVEKSGVPKRPGNRLDRMLNNGGQPGGLVEPPLGVVENHRKYLLLLKMGVLLIENNANRIHLNARAAREPGKLPRMILLGQLGF